MKQIYLCDDFQVFRCVLKGIKSNMYVLFGRDDTAILIDPHENINVCEAIKSKRIAHVIILLTHEHFDHILGVNFMRSELSETCTVKVICHKNCAENIANPEMNFANFWDVLTAGLENEEKRKADELTKFNYSCNADQDYVDYLSFIWNTKKVELIYAPGHSSGGQLIYIDKDIVFTGDNLTNGNGVICKLPGGSVKDYLFITKPMLMRIPDETLICPGHGECGNNTQLMQYTDVYRKKVIR